MNKYLSTRHTRGLAVGLLLACPMLATAQDGSELGTQTDPSAGLIALDGAHENIVSSGPYAKVTKNLDVQGVGIRTGTNATTDVWALDGYAYTGTFGNPCGGHPEAGVWVWNVEETENPVFVTVIQSPVGSRSNDVRVAAMNSGDILVHSNESCGGGPGGFEIYNVDDPANPISLASVQTDDVNAFVRNNFGYVDFGEHNLFLFTQGENDYVAATVESLFGNFQIFDITDPANPVLVGFWGAEQLFAPYVDDWAALSDFGLILAANDYLFAGYGSSANRFLHDVTIDASGTQAYLANWDAGLVLLDISDVTNPTLVSVAIDPTTEDREVNSHSVWPSEDGSIVIEGEEDFSPASPAVTIESGPNAGSYQSLEGLFTQPISSLPGQVMSGPTTYVGLACAPIPPGTDIALIQRGGCRFDTKAQNALDAEYSGIVVFNSESAGDGLVAMSGDPRAIPGMFVGHSTGLLIAGVGSAADLVEGATGAEISATDDLVFNGWSGFRIWDYADPANPVLASIFNTVCSTTENDPNCDPAGTYSSHNVIVETLGNTVKAYIAWYDQGVLILDITDPYNPVETARYTGAGENFWGIYKETNKPWIYASDRNNGLVIFKEKGSGSGKAKDKD